MTALRPPSRFRPSGEQVRLLAVVLAPRDSAVELWRRFRTETDLERLEPDSHSLLPLAYRALAEAGCDDPELGRLRGAYRHAWSHNQLRLRELSRAIASLHDDGVDAIVLRAGALDVLHYRDLGVRGAYDPGLLIRCDAAADALAALARRGWRAERRHRIASWRVAALHLGAGRLELTWRAPRGSDAALLERAVGFQLAGVHAAAPSPADLLLHVCARGCAGAAAPVRWVADAAVVIRSSGSELYWPDLIEGAHGRRLHQRLSAAFRFLRDELAVPVPEPVLTELGRGPARP